MLRANIALRRGRAASVVPILAPCRPAAELERLGGIPDMAPTAWPTFKAIFLADLVTAFRRRSKAISHHARSFTLQGSVDSGTERLDTDIKLLACRIDVRLSVWDDKAIWLRLCRANSKKMGGWAFLLAFRGHISQTSGPEIVALLERSLQFDFNIATVETLRGDLLQVWHAVNLCIDETHAA
jgi:hypothetical protein